MLAGTNGLHDWLVPHVNGHVRLEKPPLAYWLTAISFRVFGFNEFAGRLPNALAGWLTLALLYQPGRRAFSPPFWGVDVARTGGLKSAAG